MHPPLWAFFHKNGRAVLLIFRPSNRICPDDGSVKILSYLLCTYSKMWFLH
ncbi:hypothetical protein CLOSTASPAR_03607 [[Clostridium] asparagiforme DSM 15981]|uniref:Uncharacterized protein n=1 Tax=[Clostridium] asparagiforme DSM 15981 TaxID=518636 RepID=C0D2W7_9FIRM|nr:hypothetical protein CLOSTASPAR_03607 [[Clostridium] asparagiforme DSM 15981]